MIVCSQNTAERGKKEREERKGGGEIKKETQSKWMFLFVRVRKKKKKPEHESEREGGKIAADGGWIDAVKILKPCSLTEYCLQTTLAHAFFFSSFFLKIQNQTCIGYFSRGAGGQVKRRKYSHFFFVYFFKSNTNSLTASQNEYLQSILHTDLFSFFSAFPFIRSSVSWSKKKNQTNKRTHKCAAKII